MSITTATCFGLICKPSSGDFVYANDASVIGCDSLGKNHFVMLLHFNKYFYFLPHSVTVSLLCITASAFSIGHHQAYKNVETCSSYT